jgi:2-polyprenyl-6-methoxyphenol hydroxylase-like FAD-dependent oxidoreductase
VSTADPTPSRHSVVIGSGIAGLFAARALAPHCHTVTLVEKDTLPDSPVPRPGVPQGNHIHVMLAGGVRALDRLFPGGVDDLVSAGARRFDYGESRYHMLGHWMPRVTTGLPTLALTQPFIEYHVRRWLGRFPNVQFIRGTATPAYEDASSRVTGVSLQDGTPIPADLVVDATGRNSRLPRWLEEHGFGRVRQIEVGFNLGYATGRFRVPASVLPDHPMLYIVGRAPRYTRVGVIVQLENGMVYGGMGGYQGDHPPGDPEGFLAFANSLVQPEVYRVLAASEFLGPIVRYRIPASVRRYFGRMPRFPGGILPIGDVVCSYDPAFGHGMSAAALQAEVLDHLLARHSLAGTHFTRDYFRHIDRIVDVPWNLCCGENFKYPGTTGRRSLLFPVSRRVKDHMVLQLNPKLIADFYGVVTLTKRPQELLRPRTIGRMLL